ncbi:hypothetical protein Patl1_12150 [Pistacia atlantica]|uniref:Uncharacterized protein n=1 Tax=Pistacia atlantica TaxID=434234 RepID=A0ACC1A5K2_9ROSI|nr:hypothetical protein Patl1_12150 [Pistacia atlantica]
MVLRDFEPFYSKCHENMEALNDANVGFCGMGVLSIDISLQWTHRSPLILDSVITATQQARNPKKRNPRTLRPAACNLSLTTEARLFEGFLVHYKRYLNLKCSMIGSIPYGIHLDSGARSLHKFEVVEIKSSAMEEIVAWDGVAEAVLRFAVADAKGAVQTIKSFLFWSTYFRM